MIADNIPQCGILVDVGTDHAYIPIYAVKNALCEKGRSHRSERRADEKSRRQRQAVRTGKNIETRQGNGLEPVTSEECEAVVVAGMGGDFDPGYPGRRI